MTTHSDQAYQWMMQTFEDPDTIVDRATAALNTLAAQDEVNAEKLAAIGFVTAVKWCWIWRVPMPL